MTNHTPLSLQALKSQCLCRERAANMYSVVPYSIASSFVELPYLVVQTLVFSPIVFFLVGFTNEAGWEFWYVSNRLLNS